MRKALSSIILRPLGDMVDRVQQRRTKPGLYTSLVAALPMRINPDEMTQPMGDHCSGLFGELQRGGADRNPCAMGDRQGPGTEGLPLEAWQLTGCMAGKTKLLFQESVCEAITAAPRPVREAALPQLAVKIGQMRDQPINAGSNFLPGGLIAIAEINSLGHGNIGEAEE